MQASELMTRLHGIDIYAGFDATQYPDDIQGWNSEHPLLREAIRVIRPGLVIEVGVWKGASTIFIAEQLRVAGLESAVLAIGTFLGSITELTQPESRAALASHHGWPQLVHIDAAHDHESVARDLSNYYSLLAPGGALVGDDFTTRWPEVAWAATEFAHRNHLTLQQHSGKFLVQKPNA